ncbi:CDP-diacylglycerol--glycerol-3-phosphate 3-phosphatidyltransferase [Mumia zhuanghuii]|uniref:CDP-diacylglycerol--glycerol-3-phosphate 3-phosphatidyltransferase n=2 Tax=Mumia TaxID=1546255 RepID=A0ABW1QT36_9ACTN|nr:MULTISPECIES: CDP-diacylglycerol--glycerol-3-phosphate 3-phosphatidyltransferase [Mumia]KAA1420621.1 CDP-diacylglycerol--glycerol-3-phosphate 3-phosphatidyltransferase [Mumia zhuanghuii]
MNAGHPNTGQASGATTPASGEAPSNYNIANALTVLRIAFVPLFGWLLLIDGGGDTTLRLAAWAVFVVAMATDRIDGNLARSRGLITDFGKIADPIADKALTGMAFVGLSIIGALPWWVTIVVLVREWGITVMRFAVIRYGVMPASRGGKLKTVLQAVALGAYIFPIEALLPDWMMWIAYLSMGAAVLVTVVTGFDYVAQAVRMVREAKSSTPATDAGAGQHPLS